jgi:hypothetical protein
LSKDLAAWPQLDALRPSGERDTDHGRRGHAAPHFFSGSQRYPLSLDLKADTSPPLSPDGVGGRPLRKRIQIGVQVVVGDLGVLATLERIHSGSDREA